MIRNEYTMMIEKLCFEVIPGYKPPVQIKLVGRFALSDSPTPAMVKAPTALKFTVDIRVKT